MPLPLSACRRARPALPARAALALAAALAGCAAPPQPAGAPPHAAGVAPLVAVEDSRREAAALRVATLDAQRVDRVSGGVDAAVLQSVGELGWPRWLDVQLHPQPFALPSAVAERISQLRLVREPQIERLRADVAQRKAADQIADEAQRTAAQLASQKRLAALADDADQRWLLYAVHSPNQVQERMVWFWVNHFNVAQSKADLRAYVGDYEAALRAHALGRFRDLLQVAALNPAMLRYLDNERNAAGQLNENFARELMELHTLGIGAAYSQADVQEMARVLTGTGVRVDDGAPRLNPAQQARYVRDGAFEFNPARHDAGDKTVLGRPVRGGGLEEVREMLDRLARDPATAHHVCLQLAQYFVADAPPPALVDRLAQRFLATDGDIAAVLKTLFTAPEFDASLGQRFKDPWQYVVSATRLAYDGSVVLNAAPVMNNLIRLGESPFGYPTPEGYPLAEAAWSSPGQMTTRFEIARYLVGGHGEGNPAFFRADGVISLATPARARVESAAWQRTQGPRLSEATRQALADTLRTRPGDWAWVAIVSPEFMRN